MLKSLIYIALSSFSLVLTAQSTFQVIIEKNDSTSPSFVSHSITEVNTGDIYAVGTINPNGSFSEIRLVKLNHAGIVLWDTTYSNTETPASYEFTYEFWPEIMPAYDGGVIVACHSYSYSNGEEENMILIWKINEEGAIEWQKVLNSFSFTDMLSTQDSSYLFLGQIREDWSNQMDIVVYKTDLYGNELWKTQLGQPWLYDNISSIKEIKEQIFVCGHQNQNGWSDFDGILYMLNSDGSLEWEVKKEHTSEEEYYIWDVLKFGNRYYFRADDLYEFKPSTGEYWSVKDSTEFEVTGYQVLCGIDEIVAIRRIASEGYYLRLFNSMDGFYYEKLVPEISGSFVEMIVSKDGGTIVLTNGSQSMQIAKTDCLGNVDFWSEECNPKIPDDEQLLIYPNPSENEIRIDATFDFNEVVIYSPNGQHISFNNPCNCQRQTIDISKLSAGVYIVRISSDKNYAISRFVKI